MWYLLKVDVLVGVFVFASASLAILALFTWQEAKTFATGLFVRGRSGRQSAADTRFSAVDLCRGAGQLHPCKFQQLRSHRS
jgi:hypothetical protein